MLVRRKPSGEKRGVSCVAIERRREMSGNGFRYPQRGRYRKARRPAIDMSAFQFRKEIRHALSPGSSARLIAPAGIWGKAADTGGRPSLARGGGNLEGLSRWIGKTCEDHDKSGSPRNFSLGSSSPLPPAASVGPHRRKAAPVQLADLQRAPKRRLAERHLPFSVVGNFGSSRQARTPRVHSSERAKGVAFVEVRRRAA